VPSAINGTERRSVPPLRTRSLSSDGTEDCYVRQRVMPLTVTAKDQAGRIYQGSGLVPRLLSIILLIRIMYIFHGEDIIHVLRRLRKIGRGRGLCPQQERAAVPGCGTSAISSSDDKGDIQSERNNNTNIRKITSVDNRKHGPPPTRETFNRECNRLHRSTKGDAIAIIERWLRREWVVHLTSRVVPRGTVWWIFRERV